MPATAIAPPLEQIKTVERSQPARPKIDLWLLAGIFIAIAAVLAGIASAGIRIQNFFQPTGMLIVLGGTFGVTLITTPRVTLYRAARGAVTLLRSRPEDREALIEEIVDFSKIARSKGLFAIEPLIGSIHHSFLRDSLQWVMDAHNRTELQTTLDIKLRQTQRQGETEAAVFEVAGGFAPTIGIIGTVVGLMDVLRQFSNVASVAAGTSTAFISTIYGLGLANLILLPAAQRMRAHVADQFEIHEMIVEGALCLFDGVHPALIRDRLGCFLSERV